MKKKNSLFSRFEIAVKSCFLKKGDLLLIGHKSKDGWLTIQSDRETKRHGGKIYLVTSSSTWKLTKDKKWKQVASKELPVAISVEVAVEFPHHSYYKE